MRRAQQDEKALRAVRPAIEHSAHVCNAGDHDPVVVDPGVNACHKAGARRDKSERDGRIVTRDLLG